MLLIKESIELVSEGESIITLVGSVVAGRQAWCRIHRLQAEIKTGIGEGFGNLKPAPVTQLL